MTDLLDLVSEVGNGFDGEVIVAEDGLTLDLMHPDGRCLDSAATDSAS